MLQAFFDELNTLGEVTIIFRTLLAIFLGGLIGMDRQLKQQPAGFRTYALVCLGASLVMTTNQYITEVYQMGDPSRLGAQVVSGIGFLGAGSIIVTKQQQIRGLTTAAGLWASACTGLAIGIGFYKGAITAGVGIVFVMTLLTRIDTIAARKGRIMRLNVFFGTVKDIQRFNVLCQKENISILNMQIIKDKKDVSSNVMAILTIRMSVRKEHNLIIQQIADIDGVKLVQEQH